MNGKMCGMMSLTILIQTFYHEADVIFYFFHETTTTMQYSIQNSIANQLQFTSVSESFCSTKLPVTDRK